MIFHFLSHVYLNQCRILAGALPLSKYLLMENQVQEEETISKVFKLSGGIRVRIPQDLDVVVFGLGISMSCRGFLALESRRRGFLSSEKMSWNHDVVG